MLDQSIASRRNCQFILMLTVILFITYIILIEKHKSNCKFNSNSNFDYKHVRKFDEPIDVVYTWVNGSDPKFQTAVNKYRKTIVNTKPELKIELASNRFDYKDELKFSLRSLELHAPWIRHVYIVTNGQVPTWLNLSYEKVSIVTHEQIYLNKSNLPTFSSSAIENAIHRIPGLSKHFIYFNDDFLLGQPITIDDFITSNDEYLIYLETRIVTRCAPDCSWSIIGNGYCDPKCYNSQCQYDGGDCINETITEESHRSKMAGFYASLQFVERLYNMVYGFRVRYKVAHLPYMINRNILKELQRKFADLYTITESNRVRSENDMLLPISYYYYLIEETKMMNIEDIFEQYDLDDSNAWSVDEMNRIPLTEDEKINFNEILLNCNRRLYTHSISKKIVLNCSPLTKFLIKKFGTQPKYKRKLYDDVKDGIYTYLILNSNEVQVKENLDEIKMNLGKFLCLNDNLTPGNVKVNEQVKKYILEFYLSLFPNPSQFELSTNN